MKIALAQINTTVGDFEGNLDLLKKAYQSAVELGAELAAKSRKQDPKLFFTQFVVFSDMWENPRPGLEDSGRGEAPTDLTDKLLDAATHILAFESKTSKWTKIVAEMANEIGLPTYVYHLEDSE